MTKTKDKIFLFDVNHTLINTAAYHEKAVKAVKGNLKKHIDKEAAEYIAKRFDELFLLMVAGFLFRTDEEWKKIDGGRKSYENLLDLISKHQVKVKEEWGFIKKWSREVFLKIAADEINVHLLPDLIMRCATIYWDTITDLTEPFDEAKEIVNYIFDRGYPVYLLTSSDGRLQIKNGYFRYDDKISGGYKKNRMETLRSKELKFRNIIVGDPEDKPLPEYYKRAVKFIEEDLGRKIDLSDLVMTGNSFEDDLETPMLLGFGTGFLFKEGEKLKKENTRNVYKIGSLLQMKDILGI
ncbi:hypothetical protein M1615_04000 [Patescibacteria group bacterium]|nr:hypothetical protein [Patescibacteria group bacterium]